MRRRWLLEVDGRPHQLDASWDLVFTGRGTAWVDGVEVTRWWSLKFPGIVRKVPVQGYSVELVSLLASFDISLAQCPKVRAIDPPLAIGYSPRASVERDEGLAWAVLAIAALVLLGAFAGVGVLMYVRMILSWLGFG